MADFFVSYNHDDQQWATWIARELEQAGYTTIIQAWDFRPGANFVLEMDRATREARRTVAVLSPSYLNALYTHPEWAAAFRTDPTGRKRALIPVRVRRVELSGLLAQIIYVDFVGLDEARAREALLAAVRDGRTETTTAFPVGSPAPVISAQPGSGPAPDDPLSQATRLAEQGHIAGAIALLHDLAAKEPGRAIVHYNLGVLYDALAKTSDAVHHYRRAIALGDEFGDAHSNLGLIYLRAQKYDAAAAEFRAAIDANHAHCNALHGLGSVEVAAGRPADAVAWFKRALELRPRDPVILNNLADALLRGGQLEEAREQIRKARLIDPDHEGLLRTEQEIAEVMR